MMVNKDNECLTDTVATESKAISSQESSSKMPSVVTSTDSADAQQSMQNVNNNQNNDVAHNKSENSELITVQTEEKEQQQEPEQQEGEDDEFIRITAAHQMLTEAQIYDEQKNYSAALHLYRICVDLLLEELMFTEGTEQSRVYLREKCTAIMDRIDSLKTMLEPIPESSSPLPLPLSSTETTATNEEITNPPTEELNSLQIS